MQHTLIELIEIITSKIASFEEFIKAEETFSKLTYKQFNYLEVIYKLKHPTASELARELKITKPSITGLIERLEEKGYVKRVKSDDDRRVAHIHLSKKGELVNELHDRVHQKFAALFSKKLNSSELKTLILYLNKVVR